MTRLSDIDHYYVCLGCESQHSTSREAVVCCAVVQEVWQCRHCETRHPNLRLAMLCIAAHLKYESDVKQTATV